MKKITLFILGVCLLTINLTSAKAEETITYKRLNNIYFNLTVDGKTESNHVTAFYLGNRLAYCIEPGKDITTKTYEVYPDWSKTTINEETRSYIEKLGYYGYEYPNHQTDKYYIATQELIWKAVNNSVNIYWTTQENGGGQIIDIEKEKQEILNLVEKHNIKPSFINSKIKGQVGETIEIEDANNTLNNYELSESLYHTLEIKDNKLVITFNEEETQPEEITLTRKNYDSNVLLIYVKDDSQKLAALRLSNTEQEKIILQNYKKAQPEPEIVKVPSTADNEIIKHFGITWTTKNNVAKFN